MFANHEGEDILAFTETWLSSADQPPSLPGYHALSFPRPREERAPSRRRLTRGGLAVYVRADWAPHTTVWSQSEMGTHVWLRVDRAAGLGNHLMLALCYMPPARRGHAYTEATADFWQTLAAEIPAAQAEGWVLLAGDFNARTASLPDWPQGVDHHNDALLDVVVCSQAAAPVPPTCLERQNQDRGTNAFGRHLLSLCRSSDLRICNGRLPGDRDGKFTCHPLTGGHSTVDYFLACPSLMPLCHRLRVDSPFTGTDHCILRLTLDCIATQPSVVQTSTPAPGPALHPGYWVQADLIPAFEEAFSNPAQTELLRQLTEEAEGATSVAHLTAVGAALDASMHSCLHDAGMPVFHPRIDEGHRQRQRARKQEDTTIRQLKRLRRRAVRRGDFESMRCLDREILRLARIAKRRRLAAQQTAMVELAKSDRNAFWRKWKKPTPASHQVAPGDFLEYFKELLGSGPPALPAGLQEPAAPMSASPSPATDQLLEPISDGEVIAGIEGLQARKAVLGYLRPEFLKPVASTIAPVLAALFNACARVGGLPADWTLGAITPILKPGGTPTDCGSYRGITVGTLLGKLYASVLEARLSAWAEGNEIRARGQAGFRKDHRTSDQALVLRTLVEQQRYAGQALYCCFVDFQKAFDCVPRQLLWQKLQARGVTGWFLEAIKALYNDVPVCVRTAQGLSECFPSLMGTKQGCPLSPTLFGLYIDDLEDMLHEEGHAGQDLHLPSLGGEVVPALLYADDLALVSTSAKGLQQQLRLLEQYCARSLLTVNTTKTKVLVFRPPGKLAAAARGTQFTYLGQPVVMTKSFKYLGMEFHCTKPFGPTAIGTLAEAGNRAVHAMRRRCVELGIGSPLLHTQLFDALVRPVLSHCCEVWSPQLLSGMDHAGEALHRGFLRRLLGVRASTPNLLLLAETGRFPLSVFWATLTARYWSRLVDMAPGRLVRQAFEASLGLAQQPLPPSLGHAYRPWAAQVADVFESLGVAVCLQSPAGVSDTDVAAALQSQYTAQLSGAEGSKTTHYYHAVRGGEAAPEHWQPAAYLDQVADRPRLVRLAQLRTGSHWLRVETGRWQELERAQRTCPHCGPAAVEDEEHMALHCPQYSDIRSSFPTLFAEQGGSLYSFLQQDPVEVASFVWLCHARHAAAAAV